MLRPVPARAAATGAAVVAVALVLPAAAQSPSPYDMTFRPRDGAVEMRADMSADAGVVGTVPAGARGLVLRWCRSEIPFGSWQFGSRKEQLKLLDQRWCEISYEGRIGNVPGSSIEPE